MYSAQNNYNLDREIVPNRTPYKEPEIPPSMIKIPPKPIEDDEDPSPRKKKKDRKRRPWEIPEIRHIEKLLGLN